jgi:hypothetical protein
MSVKFRPILLWPHLSEELQGIGIPPALQADAHVLAGRYDEELGRKQEALSKYRAAAASMNARAASQGKLREIALRLAMNDMPRKDAKPGDADRCMARR